MSYEPQPGTIPARVVAHLRTHPPGTWLATAEITDACGLSDGQRNLQAYCVAAVGAGLLRSRKAEGERWLLWSLGNGKPLSPASEEDDDPPIRLRVPTALEPILKPEPKVTAREYIAAIERAVPPDPEPEKVTEERVVEHIAAPAAAPPLPRARAGTAPARWGIFSDGELHIQKAGAEIVLERFEFESLVGFLERMGEGAT